MNKWLKELRAELGRARDRAKVSQSDLAEQLHVGLSAVAKWEMKKNPQLPERDSYLKLMRLASPALRARAPQLVDLPEVSDPDRSVPTVSNGGTNVDNELEAAMTLLRAELESITDKRQMRQAATEAMNAITKARENPSTLDADTRPDRARRSK